MLYVYVLLLLKTYDNIHSNLQEAGGYFNVTFVPVSAKSQWELLGLIASTLSTLVDVNSVSS